MKTVKKIVILCAAIPMFLLSSVPSRADAASAGFLSEILGWKIFKETPEFVQQTVAIEEQVRNFIEHSEWIQGMYSGYNIAKNATQIAEILSGKQPTVMNTAIRKIQYLYDAYKTTKDTYDTGVMVYNIVKNDISTTGSYTNLANRCYRLLRQTDMILGQDIELLMSIFKEFKKTDKEREVDIEELADEIIDLNYYLQGELMKILDAYQLRKVQSIVIPDELEYDKWSDEDKKIIQSTAKAVEQTRNKKTVPDTHTYKTAGTFEMDHTGNDIFDLVCTLIGLVAVTAVGYNYYAASRHGDEDAAGRLYKNIGAILAILAAIIMFKQFLFGYLSGLFT